MKIITDTENSPMREISLHTVFQAISNLTNGLWKFDYVSDFKAQMLCMSIAVSKGWELINYVDHCGNNSRLNELNGLDSNPISVKTNYRTKAIAVALLWGLIQDLLKQYEEGLISIGKLADTLGVSHEETSDLLKLFEIPKDMGVNSLAELEEDIANA